MAREILNQSEAHQSPAGGDQMTDKTSSVEQSRSLSEAAINRDALSGALPAWDLLPAVPFVRRVK